jgi:hypothetical protein
VPQDRTERLSAGSSLVQRGKACSERTGFHRWRASRLMAGRGLLVELMDGDLSR